MVSWSSERAGRLLQGNCGLHFLILHHARSFLDSSVFMSLPVASALAFIILLRLAKRTSFLETDCTPFSCRRWLGRRRQSTCQFRSCACIRAEHCCARRSLSPAVEFAACAGWRTGCRVVQSISAFWSLAFVCLRCCSRSFQAPATAVFGVHVFIYQMPLSLAFSASWVLASYSISSALGCASVGFTRD